MRLRILMWAVDEGIRLWADLGDKGAQGLRACRAIKAAAILGMTMQENGQTDIDSITPNDPYTS